MRTWPVRTSANGRMRQARAVSYNTCARWLACQANSSSSAFFSASNCWDSARSRRASSRVSRASRLRAWSLRWTLRFSRARRLLLCMRLSRCMVARCGLSRRVSTRDLLDRSSRLFRRSAVTRSTRSPFSVVRLVLCGAGADGGSTTGAGDSTFGAGASS
ncbi:hypothetical protein D9M73_154070 [compost metagenome]